MDSRPKLVDTETGVFYPISIYDDLKEALEIMKTASLSIRPYQQDWYSSVFLPAFGELDPEPNCKRSEYYGHVVARESVVGLTAKQLADKMNKQGTNISIAKIYENYLRPLKEQGIINSVQSVLNGKEYLYYPINIENDSISTLPLTEDCRLIINKPFDEKNVLEESLGTLSRRRRNGGDSKYKIIDVDGSELSISQLLEKYFFNKNYYTSCAVILTKYHNNSIKESSIVDEKINTDEKEEDKKSEESDGSIGKIDNSTDDTAANETNYSSYRYTKDNIDNFFESENGQQEDHTIEQSICKDLIGQQNTRPFFYYCKLDLKVEFLHLNSIEDHIRLKDPQRHKAKLLECLDKGEEKN